MAAKMLCILHRHAGFVRSSKNASISNHRSDLDPPQLNSSGRIVDNM